MPLTPSIPDLAKFLKSALTPPQIRECMDLLKDGAVEVLDPESAGDSKQHPALGKANASLSSSVASKPAVAQGLEEILREMEEAYTIDKFPPPTPDEARRLGDAFPGLSARISAYQGRNLVKMLRERMKGS